MDDLARAARPRSNLALRVASALVLAPLAIAVTYVGQWPFILFWAIAAVAIWWEWVRLAQPSGGLRTFLPGACALTAAAVLCAMDKGHWALLIVAAGAVGAAVLARGAAKPEWAAGGVCYAGAMLIGVSLLRSDATLGFIAIVFIYAIVWGTDILGYCVGRAVGGPKLAPSISPNKTWSGAIAGLACALIASLVIARVAGIENMVALALIAIALSAISQAGDLLESAIKRRFHVKDASGLIPGHGGVMDRLDGFWAASVAAAILGTLHGGPASPASGLLVW